MSSAKNPFVEVSAGAVVFNEGDAGGEMYIIETGQVDILRQARGNDAVATLGPGDFFGEMAILEDQPRFASAVAKSDCRLLRIERSAFAEVLKQNVEIAVRIMRKLVARQRRTEQRLQDLLAEHASKVAPVATPEAPPASRATNKPIAAAPAPAAAVETRAAPVVAVRAGGSLVLRHASGQVMALDASRSEFLVGRPDPVTGIQPEINLGPLDAARSLSRRHAKILHEGGLYFVREEVGTTNGTFVNGERLKTGATVPLKVGDKLRFGSVEVDFAPA